MHTRQGDESLQAHMVHLLTLLGGRWCEKAEQQRRVRAGCAGDGAGWWSDGQRVQHEGTCLMSASRGGHMEIVKYLCQLGGKELLVRADKVSGRMHVLMRACRAGML
jgi:hypothetical protein